MHTSTLIKAPTTLKLPLLQEVDIIAQTDWNPNYIVAILSGVLLALAFQLILTALSVAIGITAVGDLKKSYIKNKLGTYDSDFNAVRDAYEFDQDYGSGTSLGVKITTGFGIWSVITTCISLFAATAIAVRMSIFSIDGTDIATGLVIWALFFIILFYLEMRVANTVIGGLINTALSGLRGTTDAIKNALAPSDSTKMNKVIENTVSQIRNEFGDVLDSSQLNDTVNRFFETADRKLPDYNDLMSDLEGIAKKSSSKNNMGKWIAIQQVARKLLDKNSKDPAKKGKSEQLKSLLSTIQSKYAQGDTTYDSLANVATALTPADREKIDGFYKEFRDYFSTTSDKGLDTKSIKTTLQKIFKDPTVLKTMIGNNVKEINRESIVELLDKNTSLERDRIDEYADTVEEQLQSVKNTYYEKYDGDLLGSAEKSIENFFNNTDREELRYDALKDDFSKALDNPKESFSIIKNRLGKMDIDTVRALLTNNKYISEKNLDHVLSQFESAKTQVSEKFNSMQTELDRRLENVKRKAVIRAEQTRRTAASAAWWLVITAVLAAGAAIGGSALAI